MNIIKGLKSTLTETNEVALGKGGELMWIFMSFCSLFLHFSFDFTDDFK